MVNDIMVNRKSPLWIKLDILSNGVRCDENSLAYEAVKAQNPKETRRTGNAGLQLELSDSGYKLNVAVKNDFSDCSPYVLIVENDEYFIKNTENNQKYRVKINKTTLDYYSKPLDADHVVGELALIEGDGCCIASISSGCVFFDLKKQCKFCAIGCENQAKNGENHEKIAKIRKNNLKNALKTIVLDKNAKQVNLTGGNTITPDRGASQYYEYIDAIREVNMTIPIAIEVCPPKPEVCEEVLLKLKKRGATTLIMNIEFFNSKIRRELMPIKGRIAKSEYMFAYKKAIEIFGKNNVICGIIVGVEPLEETFKAVDAVAKIGVIPEVYPFKPNRGSEMANHPKTQTDVVFEASVYANKMMKKYGINPLKARASCMACGACGITKELFKENSNEI